MRRTRWWALAGAMAVVVLGAGVAAALLRPAAAPVPVANRAFRDAPHPSAPAVVWAVGDATGDAGSRRVVARIAAERPARVLYLGDVYESGAPLEFQRTFPAVYGALVHRIAPTPGNHDWPLHDVGYDPYWRSVTRAPTPPWYAFRVGGWRILSLNSETPEDPGQRAFIRDELARTRGTCTIALWHRPRFSAGSHGDEPDVAPLWDAVRGRVALVLDGHEHNLQRLRPIGGTTEVISGAGGRSHYTLDRRDPRLAFANDQRFGALRLALRRGVAQLRFVTDDGTVVDRSTVRC